MKETLEQLWQQYCEEHFIEILTEFLAEMQTETVEGASCWTLLRVPIEFDPDIVIEAAYSCRKNNFTLQIPQSNQIANPLFREANTDAAI
ncbi:MAG TPA: hypothetical protein DDW76_09580 [Cyanobacteria bacterium UBA11369]|nr:hypothetical protein [Cyanobacteria bacterium UBA11371]HBE34970.1 hypothetical protein [Cyanobacteria bacterium UBA11368]HBE49026.1 hypothetical protein [Cyanobacteria bacterium UBA11369]